MGHQQMRGTFQSDLFSEYFQIFDDIQNIYETHHLLNSWWSPNLVDQQMNVGCSIQINMRAFSKLVLKS